MMFSNSCGELKRPSAETVAVKLMPCGVGSAPTEPAANYTFWLRTAVSTWVADRL